jgi:hypothetical protein
MKKLALAVAVLCVSSIALAADGDKPAPKWSYVEAGYMDFNPDNGLDDNGAYAGVSFGFLKMIHVFAEYDDIGDYTFWNAGAGWHGLFGDPADLYAQVQWNDVKVDTGTNDVSDDGYEVAVGARWKILKWLEVMGEVSWADYSDSGDDTQGKVGVLFSFLNDHLGVGATYELGDADVLRGYARFSWGK